MKGDIKKYYLKYTLHNLISSFASNLNLNTEDIEKFSIGITVILLNLFEMIIVFILSAFLRVIKESLMFFIMFIILRALGCGIHCKTFGKCILITVIVHISSVFLSIKFPINITYALIISLIFIIILFKYAPADTENRPIIGELIRQKLKIQITIFSLIIVFINLIILNKVLFNISMYAIVMEGLSVLPCTYKLFNQSYNNYKAYE